MTDALPPFILPHLEQKRKPAPLSALAATSRLPWKEWTSPRSGNDGMDSQRAHNLETTSAAVPGAANILRCLGLGDVTTTSHQATLQVSAHGFESPRRAQREAHTSNSLLCLEAHTREACALSRTERLGPIRLSYTLGVAGSSPSASSTSLYDGGSGNLPALWSSILPALIELQHVSSEPSAVLVAACAQVQLALGANDGCVLVWRYPGERPSVLRAAESFAKPRYKDIDVSGFVFGVELWTRLPAHRHTPLPR